MSYSIGKVLCYILLLQQQNTPKPGGKKDDGKKASAKTPEPVRYLQDTLFKIILLFVEMDLTEISEKKNRGSPDLQGQCNLKDIKKKKTE